jgi:hypothetical protein
MPDTSLTRSPKFQKGGLVQLVETITKPVPNIVVFQYNPATISRTLKPWNPLEVSQTDRGLPSPAAQPFDPEETITMEIELDASDALEDDKLVAKRFGISDRIAALEKMLFPGDSPLGQVLAIANSLFGGKAQPAERRTVPATFLVWGVGRILPVRITQYSIEEQLFLPSLHPAQAKINLSMQVLTPEVFKCATGLSTDLARGAYSFNRKRQDVLALLNVANNVEEIRTLLPFG